MKSRACELCKSEAALFCPSDSAFLCWNCDSKVHGANFLVARHVRRTICSNCNGFTSNRVSGVRIKPLSQICRSCSPEIPCEDRDSLSSSSSSACISSTASCAKKIDFDRQKADGIVSSSPISELSVENSYVPLKLSGEFASRKAMKHDRKAKNLRSRAPAKLDSKAEDILVNWSRKLELDDTRTVAVASRAFGVCLDELTDLPFRVSLASSLWFSFRLCGDRSASTWQILKRLEEISGVAAKLILVAESRLARVLKTRRARRQHQQEEQEGWAETQS